MNCLQFKTKHSALLWLKDFEVRRVEKTAAEKKAKRGIKQERLNKRAEKQKKAEA